MQEQGTILAPGERFGVVGGGNMARALVFPLFEKGLLKPEQVSVSATSETTLFPWKEYGCLTTTDNNKVTAESDIILWGVKPQIFPMAVQTGWNLREKYTKSTSLNISVMAGVSVADFARKLESSLTLPPNTPYQLRCVRTMPNIGSKVSSGCTVFNIGATGLDVDRQFLYKFFNPLGLCFEVAEAQMNAYSALFGCGIGFMFPVLEAMSDGAVKMGVPRAVSLRLAAQTMKGAGDLILQENLHPGELKDRVCSPGGTTIAGIAELEKHGIRDAFISAIEASTKRADYLVKF